MPKVKYHTPCYALHHTWKISPYKNNKDKWLTFSLTARPSFCSRSRLKIETELIVLPRPDTECFQLSSRQLHSNMHSTRPQCSTSKSKVIQLLTVCLANLSILLFSSLVIQYCVLYNEQDIEMQLFCVFTGSYNNIQIPSQISVSSISDNFSLCTVIDAQ